MKDPIAEEVCRARDAHTKQFNYNLDAICEDLQNREKASGQPTVFLSSKRKQRTDPDSAVPAGV